MAAQVNRRNALFGATSLALLGACSGVSVTPARQPVSVSELAGLPYHPVIYHLDLCILSYQLYAQSLVWPFDPYYEKHGRDADRSNFMGRVRNWARSGSPHQAESRPVLAGYRGPGLLANLADNPHHDPLLFRYDALLPWSSSLSLAEDAWIEQRSPRVMTQQIASVFMCYRRAGGDVGDITIAQVARAGSAALADARDKLFAFEGGTGDKGEPGQPESQSLMGFVLKRQIQGSSDYDVHIVFRGSRSGSAARAVWQASSSDEAQGNPDWITSLGTDFIEAEEASPISGVGRIHRGFTHSIQSILPQIMGCLSRIDQSSGGRPPRRIFATGHSLGGALAQHFTSAVLLGTHYGPGGTGAAMPAHLRRWPWTNIKLITFGAPFGGDEVWARTLTSDILQSRFFERAAPGLTRTDPNALSVSQPEIAHRLVDQDHPAAFRVLNPADPITTLRFGDSKHVGETVYVSSSNPLGLADVDAHEPADIRNQMLSALADPSLPDTGWVYRDLSDFSPESTGEFDGSAEMFDQLARAIERYYREHSSQVDLDRLSGDYAIFRSLLVE